MSKILYKSTRGKDTGLSSSEAIIKGIAPDGGLYVPDSIPEIDMPLTSLSRMDYKQLALHVMARFLTDFSSRELEGCIARAYDRKFDTPLIAPLVEKDGIFFLELFHGPTLAFKDLALSILPHLLKTAVKKYGIDKEIVILVATSGDTGKAALEGFAGVRGTKIIVFYPKNGVSIIQERHMITQAGDNTYAVGIKGNFDDTQRGVKQIFSDKEINKSLNKKGYIFSSANSINIGRLIPQIVYYIYAYCILLKSGKIKEGDAINVVVPTGNFGNILAAYYTKKMGLPIARLICASNENNVLYNFIRTGLYDKKRKLIVTSSPSMDILVSSNLERLLYDISGSSPDTVCNMANELNKTGEFKITDDMKKKMSVFYGEFATDNETFETIKSVFSGHDYLLDPHTAVGYNVYRKYVTESGDSTKTVIVSTASPFKFPGSVTRAIDNKYAGKDEFSLLKTLSDISGMEIPMAVKDIEKRKITHNTVCRPDQMKDTLFDILK